jgi:ribonuclease D
MLDIQNYTLVETVEALNAFYEDNCEAAWMAVDTEFIGERRFETLLCLIQVATEKGFYLIDPIALKDLTPFLHLLENETILKITHAGDNDYRLINIIYGTIPKNLFDTQIAAGFVGLGYPTSYGKLVEKELHVQLDKGYAATDWEHRPLKKKQLEYALADVLHLHILYEKLRAKLVKNKRFDWVKHETARWESAQYYERDPHREALMNTLMNNVRQPKQVFLLRIYEWRRNEAQRLNHSKEMIFPAKYIATVLRGIDSGKQSLLDSRIIPDRIVEQHWKTFQALYQQPTTEEELNVLKRLPPLSKEDPKKDISMELLHVLVKAKCMESGIAPQLVMNKSDLTYAQPGEGIFSNHKLDWRTDFLGEAMMKWLNDRGELSVNMADDKVIITMKE